MNTYAYVGGNPLNFIDPTGEVAQGIIIGGGLLGGGLIIQCTLSGTCQSFGEAVADGINACRDFLLDDTDKKEYCRKEKERCAEDCADAMGDPNRKHVYGGSMSQCIKNCLPEECGGEPKWKGYIDK